ncbi:MAG: hypothetical protein ABIG94_06600 [Pseudomonadota bacterium]
MGRLGVTPGAGWVGRGALEVVGGDADLEPRLPVEERPPPARAQASACIAPALKNKRAKRISKPFSQVLDIMVSSSFEFRVSSI